MDSQKEYTVTEVAEMLGVSRMTVRRIIADGAFPHARRKSNRPTSHHLIPEQDVNDFIADLKNN